MDEKIPKSSETPENATPLRDGCFLSDFYLFPHLFEDHGSNQLWVTCEDPKLSVDSYEEYIHGEYVNYAAEDRLVVLEHAFLPILQKADNLRVVIRVMVLEDFLKPFEAECI